MKKILLGMTSVLLGLTLAGCGKKDDKTTDYVRDDKWRTPAQLIYDIEHDEKADSEQITYAEMELRFRDDNDVAYYGYMKFMLFNEIAPKTVDNFVDLANDKFYDNLTISRVVTNTTIQGGDPKHTTLGKEKDDALTIEGEFEDNEFSDNVLSHRRGVISMARVSGENNSASSQFFIVTNKFTTCDGSYAAFGWLTTYDVTSNDRLYKKNEKGEKILYDYDCLDKISTLSVADGTNDGAPTQLVEIVSVRVI